jgi:hypothetical protein
MTEQSIEEINFIQLTLNGYLVGYLAGFKNGRNVLTNLETILYQWLKIHLTIELEVHKWQYLKINHRTLHELQIPLPFQWRGYLQNSGYDQEK